MSASSKPEPSELERRLDVAFHLPRLRVVWIVVAVAAAGGLLVWPLSSSARRSATSSGAVTNHHRMIESACNQCHDAAFSPVPDRACLACHPVREHAAGVAAAVSAHPDLGARCTSCHKEHHGEDSLVPRESPLCTGCHAQLDKLAPGTAAVAISDFAHHPELSVMAWSGSPPVLHEVRLDQPGLRGGSHIKFSHAEHLSQLAGDGTPALVCASCHQLGPDGRTMAAITYAQQCEGCHRTAFDDRLPDRFVPHGDSARAAAFVAAEVARLHVAQDPQVAGARMRDLVASESADDEIGLFTPGGGCFKCHDVERDAAGHFAVQPANLATRWMPAATFSHDSHQRVPCESCHAGARDSTSGRDVLLPHIATCRECHADPGTPNKVDSPCLTCHDYHAPRPR